MKSFDLATNDTWQEVLQDSKHLAFDVLKAPPVFVTLTEGDTPSASVVGNEVQSYPEDWDFEMTNNISGQKIWVRSDKPNDIKGVR